MPTRSLTSPSPPRTLSPSPERSSRSPSPSSYRSKSTRLLSVRTPASYTGLVSQSVGAVSRRSFLHARPLLARHAPRARFEANEARSAPPLRPLSCSRSTCADRRARSTPARSPRPRWRRAVAHPSTTTSSTPGAACIIVQAHARSIVSSELCSRTIIYHSKLS